MLARMNHYTAKRWVAVYVEDGITKVDTITSVKVVDLVFKKFHNIVIIDGFDGYLYKISGDWEVVDLLLNRVAKIRRFLRRR